MIRKNVDIIAVFVLLFGIALYSRARESRILEVIPAKRIALSKGGLCRAYSAFHQLRYIEYK
ncbi:MAG: hypothetical protein JOY62_15865 [Acidobacteriaceae bacterium]|nr:hypothetical protein [Acidobacteriaceae bacterium]MBV9781440.1 hypothetical protein [Acidobacteriaceae bacterium]